MICPPWIPAPGPMSITWSAAIIISLSCSTTIIELPISLNSLSELINFWLSLWCRPILGSSRIYKTSVNCEPICVARRIR